MEKIYSMLKVFTFALLIIGIQSCENEPVDAYLKDSDLVGKTVVRLLIEDSQEIFRENIYATVNKKGEFKLVMRDLMQRQDSLQLFTRLFQVGTFPGGSNPSIYWNQLTNMYYSTVDSQRPGYVTGFIKMEYINKKAQVVNGDFDLLMIPMQDKQDTTNVSLDPNISSFKVSGSFTDLPYQREEAYYLEAEINQEVFRNNIATLTQNDNAFIAKAVGVEDPEKSIIITLPRQGIEQGKTYDFSQAGFSAIYTSENGIEYDLGKSNGSFSGTSRITIVTLQDSSQAQGVLLETRFNLEMHPLGQGQDPLIVEFGSFRLTTGL